MSPPRMDVIVSRDPDDGSACVLKAPAVGYFSSPPMVGEVVVGGSRVGSLNSLGRTIGLVVPRGVTGRVAEITLANGGGPVGYGHDLLRLVPVEAGAESGDAAFAEGAEAGDLPQGGFAVRSSTHGMFYHRPRPDEPAYVEIGTVVDEGATLGLVEVMKCFSAVVYGGPDLPTRAEIVEVRADDGAEVTTDQILFVVRPA